MGIVFALMGGLAFIVKKLGLATPASMKSSDKRRLKLIESLPLDARRRLVIISCDNQEHLIILGANTESIVQNNIPPVDDSSKTI